MNIFQRIYYGIQVSDNDQFLKAIANKDLEIKNLSNEIDQLSNSILSNTDTVIELNKQVPKIDPLETYWNDKRTKNTSYTYGARITLNGTTNTKVDPRIFYTPIDSTIPEITTGTNDEKAMKALELVQRLITYTTDITQFKFDEEWLFSYETWKLKQGDCEDGAILLANILLKSGVPYWRVRLNAGDVEGGGHCWCTYLRESDNKWLILDWCYWPKDSVKGLLYSDAEKYFDIWFSFNQKYIYLDEEFERNDTTRKTETKVQVHSNNKV